MSKLLSEGFRISKNIVFRKIAKRAPAILATPVQLGMLLTTAYAQLGRTKGDKTILAHLSSVLSTFIRMVKAYAYSGYRGINTKTLLLGLGVLLYLVTPLDLIPDIIPGLGFMDDISLMTWFLTSIADDLKRFEEWEIQESFSS